jgi:hypothetical protein
MKDQPECTSALQIGEGRGEDIDELAQNCAEYFNLT